MSTARQASGLDAQAIPVHARIATVRAPAKKEHHDDR
jgi:hypothetical protein